MPVEFLVFRGFSNSINNNGSKSHVWQFRDYTQQRNLRYCSPLLVLERYLLIGISVFRIDSFIPRIAMAAAAGMARTVLLHCIWDVAVGGDEMIQKENPNTHPGSSKCPTMAKHRTWPWYIPSDTRNCCKPRSLPCKQWSSMPQRQQLPTIKFLFHPSRFLNRPRRGIE